MPGTPTRKPKPTVPPLNSALESDTAVMAVSPPRRNVREPRVKGAADHHPDPALLSTPTEPPRLLWRLDFVKGIESWHDLPPIRLSCAAVRCAGWRSAVPAPTTDPNAVAAGPPSPAADRAEPVRFRPKTTLRSGSAVTIRRSPRRATRSPRSWASVPARRCASGSARTDRQRHSSRQDQRGVSAGQRPSKRRTSNSGGRTTS